MMTRGPADWRRTGGTGGPEDRRARGPEGPEDRRTGEPEEPEVQRTGGPGVVMTRGRPGSASLNEGSGSLSALSRILVQESFSRVLLGGI